MLMNVLDLFYYLCYRFNFYILKKCEDDAKWVASLLVGVFFALLTDVTIKLYSYIWDYELCMKYCDSDIVIFLFPMYAGLSVLYFYKIKKVSIAKMTYYYSRRKPILQNVINWFMLLFYLALLGGDIYLTTII